MYMNVYQTSEEAMEEQIAPPNKRSSLKQGRTKESLQNDGTQSLTLFLSFSLSCLSSSNFLALSSAAFAASLSIGFAAAGTDGTAGPLVSNLDRFTRGCSPSDMVNEVVLILLMPTLLQVSPSIWDTLDWTANSLLFAASA